MDTEIFLNLGFAFWYIIGDYFLIAMAWTILVAVVAVIIHTLTR